MSKRPDPRKQAPARPKTKPAAARPKKTKPAANAAANPLLNKKAAARAAGDAARAAGHVDDFARNRPPAAKQSSPKPAGSHSAPASERPTPSKSAVAGAHPPRPGRKGPQLLEVQIGRLDEEGIGIGRLEGKDVVVPGALPGEQVQLIVDAEGQQRVYGRLRKVLRPHPQRIVSPCRCSNDCQGCPLINLDYPAQLQLKQVRVQSALAAYPGLKGIPVHTTWGAEHPFGYRTNAKLVIEKRRGIVRIGLYRRGTHEVVDIGNCPLHHPLINRIATVVREEIARQEIYVYDPQKERGLLRYLTIKISPSSGKAMVTFVTSERDYRQLTHLAKWLVKKVPEVISVQQNVNTSSGNVVFGRETQRLLGVDDLLDQVGEVRLRIAPTSFFQVNNEQAARIYALVREWSTPTPLDSALDLYCGIGGIALHLARNAGHVLGIELAEEAVRNARENARLNGLANCRFQAGDAAELAEELPELVPPGAVAVVNPPRSGCDRAVLAALAACCPRSLVYVSCNPETLARDLDLLHGHGYRTLEVQPVDMFPQTGHVESVARLAPAVEPKQAGKAGKHRP
jgi:23S rRNA (uracil1939-C5)-methyltransferase